MNILIVTPPQYEDFIYRCIGEIDYRGGLTFVLNNKHDYEKFVASYSYDVGISFMWTHKVLKQELDRATWFNFHPAPLPAYKGRNLCYHAIMNGETEFGATLHYMNENFDTGDIIEVSYFPILEWYTAQNLSEKTIERSKQLFVEFLPSILEGTKFLRYPNEGGTYYKKEPIVETVEIDDLSDPVEGGQLATFIRAVYYPPYYPKISIGGVTYKIVRDE